MACFFPSRRHLCFPFHCHYWFSLPFVFCCVHRFGAVATCRGAFFVAHCLLQSKFFFFLILRFTVLGGAGSREVMAPHERRSTPSHVDKLRTSGFVPTGKVRAAPPLFSPLHGRALRRRFMKCTPPQRRAEVNLLVVRKLLLRFPLCSHPLRLPGDAFSTNAAFSYGCCCCGGSCEGFHSAMCVQLSAAEETTAALLLLILYFFLCVHRFDF
ncbi:hypothetical protein ABL78_3672 [Leptomonas seymouri]|uniref:Uncharacterized protein n=1 Tax=Leptomonas seymouri TaxID=5684 RepID=A0A0N1PDG6_LEPSE|nr:hypothetical protein ABL78_3672 [Leptomonas seymouri]|eukprot:KPI87235.1 hypothetical protein ABL78_3672 [Leptomonas seymouri]